MKGRRMEYGLDYYAALVTVPATWTPDTPIGLSAAVAEGIRDQIQSGMRVLIFEAAPVNAIVAEGEIHDQTLIRLADWPNTSVRQRPFTASGQPADYMLLVRILYHRAPENQVPLSTITEWTDCPVNAEWLPLDRDAYQRFTNWP